MRIKYFFLAFILLITFCSYAQDELVVTQNGVKILKNTVIVKINPLEKSLCSKSSIDDPMIRKIFSGIKASSVEKLFPLAKSPEKETDRYGNPLVDISTIYQVHYSADISVDEVITMLKKSKIVTYAEPKVIPELLDYETNDPYIGSQYYISKIKAPQAWDITVGDSNIVIGITDTGNDIDHEDLTENVFYNYNDPINGLDDDNDGFVDNFRGWDLGDNDSNPQSDASDHGVWVSGCAAARTDNGLGIASPGFRTKFIPIKIQNSLAMLNVAYEGIIYAADHGCHIINCSWGSLAGTEFGQDIINYATFNKNALVIAGAGNNNANLDFYPASYDNVLSIAGTTSLDEKWTPENSGTSSGSNYSIYVDLCAPATQLYSTTQGSSYGILWGGTSFASPIVAGCAGIVKSRFPEMTPLQIGEQLRVTADDIDTIDYNEPYIGLLGKGRVNLYRALTDTLFPSVRLINEELTDNEDGIMEGGDTVEITGDFINYLSQTAELNVVLSSSSPFVEFIDNTDFIGILGEMETIPVPPGSLRFRILPTAPYDHTITIKLNYTDTNYTDFQYVKFDVNPTLVEIDTNNITATITSCGKIGFDYTKLNPGIGFQFKDSANMLYEGGLIMGLSGEKFAGSVRGEGDFSIVQKAEKVSPGVFSDQDIYTVFNDNNAGYKKLGLEIFQSVFAWDTVKDEDYIMLEYRFVNNSDTTIHNFYAGIFLDWDIMDYSLNKSGYDSDLKLLYSFSTEAFSQFAGVQLLSSSDAHPYAADNIAGGDQGVDVSDGLTDDERFLLISTGRYSAGGTESGNDVVNVMGAGPYNILPHDTIVIVFAMLAGEDLAAITQAAEAAQQTFDSLYLSVENIMPVSEKISIYPNPAGDEFFISLNLVENTNYSMQLLDEKGTVVKEFDPGIFKPGMIEIRYNSSSLRSGVYYLRFEGKNGVTTKKIVII
ncbi:MAG: hypothetical protein A2W91_14930 [Bacteroidetes bacterium GWF2_38_335]|nr:MAG: hypothetical protein A2W91_14930 [Bacteroidetes bacterium GWF2_38_335]OFY78492.1 MAG: hypothetical protein A2281_16240 [Bacteroidetes bacterium RIFOXYA12_FULL_38_20]HBS88440.1 hypothetical protein [Bacteroidales bacterium]